MELKPQGKCINNNDGYRVCTTQKCKKPAIFCEQKNCSCSHKDCLNSAQLNSTIEHIIVKRQSGQRIQQLLIQYCDHVIKVFEITKKSLLKYVDDDNFLQPNERKFLNALKTQTHDQQITGNLMSKVVSSMINDSKISIQDINVSMKIMVSEYEKIIQKVIYSILHTTGSQLKQILQKSKEKQQPQDQKVFDKTKRFKLSQTLKAQQIEIQNNEACIQYQGNHFLLLEPGLKYVKKEITIGIKILQSHTVTLGISYKQELERQMFKSQLDNKKQGHMIDYLGIMYSTNETINNSKNDSFQFQTDDIVHIKYCPSDYCLIIKNMSQNKKVTFNLAKVPDQTLHFSFCLAEQAKIQYLGIIE